MAYESYGLVNVTRKCLDECCVAVSWVQSVNLKGPSHGSSMHVHLAEQTGEGLFEPQRVPIWSSLIVLSDS